MFSLFQTHKYCSQSLLRWTTPIMRRRGWISGLAGVVTAAACVSIASAQSIGPVNALTPTAKSDDGDDTNLRLATDGDGNWVAVWQSNDSLDGKGSDLDILVSTSSDGGGTWSDAAALNQNAASDDVDDESPEIVYDDGGNWIVTWAATLSGAVAKDGTGSGIHYARSTDSGATWPRQGTLTTPVQQGGGIDSDPSIAADGSTAIIVWSSTSDIDGNVTDGDNPTPIVTADGDILMSVSSDGGGTWSRAVAVNTNNVTDTGEDAEPSIATDKALFWTVVWNMDGKIAFTRSEDNAVTWTAPELLPSAAGSNPQLLSDTNRSLADDSIFDGFVNTDAGYWLASFTMGDDVVVSRYLDTGPAFDGDIPEGEIEDVWREPVVVGSGADPFLATDILGTWILAWSSEDDLDGTVGTDADILFSRSINNGIEWADASALDAAAAEDNASDSSPALASGLDDNWIAGWTSTDDRDGIGGDGDLLTAPFTFFVDCNTNGITDVKDLETGASEDADGNGQLDECDQPDEPEMMDPDTMEPDTMEPDTMEPDTMEPDTTEPDTMEPDSADTVDMDSESSGDAPVISPPSLCGFGMITLAPLWVLGIGCTRLLRSRRR